MPRPQSVDPPGRVAGAPRRWRVGVLSGLAMVLIVLGCTPAPANDGASGPAGTATSTRRAPGTIAGPSASTTDGDGHRQGTSPRAPMAWSPCGRGVDCGILAVPRDRSRADSEEIDLAVARRRATGPGARIGTLLFNPGGPGAAGTDYVRAASLDPTLNQR